MLVFPQPARFPIAAPFREVFFIKRIGVGDEAPEPQPSLFAPNLILNRVIDVIGRSDWFKRTEGLVGTKNGKIWNSLITRIWIANTWWWHATTSDTEPHVSRDPFDVRWRMSTISEPIGKLRRMTRIWTGRVVEQDERSLGESERIGATFCSIGGFARFYQRVIRDPRLFLDRSPLQTREYQISSADDRQNDLDQHRCEHQVSL